MNLSKARMMLSNCETTALVACILVVFVVCVYMSLGAS
jgi:hypothetical protein